VNPHAPSAARMWTWSTSNDSSVSDAALGPAPRAEPLHVLMLPDLERADRIGEFWGHPETRTFGELLIDSRRIGRFGRCWSGCCGRPVAEDRRG
jgi:hypothetical protein